MNKDLVPSPVHSPSCQPVWRGDFWGWEEKNRLPQLRELLCTFYYSQLRMQLFPWVQYSCIVHAYGTTGGICIITDPLWSQPSTSTIPKHCKPAHKKPPCRNLHSPPPPTYSKWWICISTAGAGLSLGGKVCLLLLAYIIALFVSTYSCSYQTDTDLAHFFLFLFFISVIHWSFSAALRTMVAIFFQMLGLHRTGIHQLHRDSIAVLFCTMYHTAWSKTHGSQKESFQGLQWTLDQVLGQQWSGQN